MDKRKAERVRAGFRAMSAEEKRAMAEALQGKPKVSRVILELLAARGRTVKRQGSDKRTDAVRRVLVGARVSREKAAVYREAAARQGVSLYRFVMGALDAAVKPPVEQCDCRACGAVCAPVRAGGPPRSAPGSPCPGTDAAEEGKDKPLLEHTFEQGPGNR